MNIDRIPPDIHFNENGEIVWTPRLIDFNARAYARGHTVTADEFNTELIKQTYQGNYNTDTISILTKLYGTVNRNSVVALEKATTAESVSKQALEEVTKVLDNVTDITERAETAVERAEEALATIDGFATDEDISNALKDYYTITEVDDLIKNVEVDLSDYYTRTETDTAISTLNNSISQLDSTKLDKSEVVSLPIGSIFISAIPLTDARVHLLDGSIIPQDGIYVDFANLIKSLVATGNSISCTQAQFDADVSATGNCGKFVIDNTAGTIRLPKITTFIQGLTDLSNIGHSIEAGLPNITSKSDSYMELTLWTGGADTQYNGAINGLPTGYGPAGGSYGRFVALDFDASRSSAVYGKSTTVQPNATRFPYYIVLASGYKSSQVVDVDNIMTEVNSVRTEIAENKAINFAESERLKTLNLFDVNKASSGYSLFGTWGLGMANILTEDMIGKTICINFNSLIEIIQITNYTYLDAETEDHKIYHIAYNQSYITLEVTQDLYDNRTARYLNVYSDEVPKGQSTFSHLITVYGNKLMVTYGDEPQEYQPYRGEIVHSGDLNDYVVERFTTDSGYFRRWASGYKEWVGTIHISSESTISFSPAFTDVNYQAQFTARTSTTANVVMSFMVDRELASLTIRARQQSGSTYGGLEVDAVYYISGY